MLCWLYFTLFFISKYCIIKDTFSLLSVCNRKYFAVYRLSSKENSRSLATWALLWSSRKSDQQTPSFRYKNIFIIRTNVIMWLNDWNNDDARGMLGKSGQLHYINYIPCLAFTILTFLCIILLCMALYFIIFNSVVLSCKMCSFCNVWVFYL